MKTKSRIIYLFALAATLLPLRLAHASGRYYNTTGTLDWAMVEECRPYFQGANWSPFLDTLRPITSTEGASFASYTGVGNGATANSLWSTWPINNPINPADQLYIAYLGTTETGTDTQGTEGTAAWSSGLPPFGISTNVWYRFAIRCWQPADGTPHVGYVGEWQREGTTGVWYHKATWKTPFTVTGIKGSFGGFFEGTPPYTGAVELDFRNCYAHQYGQPATTIQNANQCSVQYNAASGTWQGGYVAPSPDDSYAIASYMRTNVTVDPLGNSYPVNCVGSTVTVTLTNQPATPPFDPIVVTNSSASVSGSQLLVQWQSPNTSSPQLGYKIEVFNNAGYTGSPAVTYFTYDTEAQQCLLAIPGVSTPYVRLSITDIFNNTNTPILITPTTPTLNPATNVVDAVSGLAYQYYQSASGVVWSNLPDFTALTPVLQGAVDYVDTTVGTRSNEYAFNFTGFIQVPTNGLYAFTLTSYDSSKLMVDGVTVINFDGMHSSADKSGWVALAAGYHTVGVQYAFTDQRGRTVVWGDVSVAYQGPGIAKQIVPPNAWFRVPGGSEPVITVATPASGSTVCGSNVTLTAGVTLNGATLNQVQYYLGDYPLGQATASPYLVNVFYGPAATNLLRARLFYNNGYSVDSAPQTPVATTNMNVSPWQLTALGYHNYPTGASVQGGAVSLTGDYLNLLTRQVTGDFTLTAHLAAMTPNVASSGAGDFMPDSAWQAGLIIRGNTNVTFGQPLGDGSGTLSTELFSAVDGGTYYEDSSMNAPNGASTRRSANLGGANRWFKIVRVGDIFYSSISLDGANWSQVWSNTLSNLGGSPYVGPFTYATQSSNPNRHWATFDSISIAGNVAGTPSVTASPATTQVSLGQSVTFTAGAIGQPPFNYQWHFNGTNIASATNGTLTLVNVQLTNGGNYTVSLTAGNGNATSSPAILTILPGLVWDAMPSVAGAQDGSGNWGGTTTNWWDGANNVVWPDNTVAAFGVNTTTNCMVTLTNDVTPSGLTFNTTGGGTYTLAGNNTIWATGSPLQIVANADATITANFNGSGGLVKGGSGTLTFSGNNNNANTGSTYINGGTLVLNAPSYNTFSGSGVYINNGSTFRVTASGGSGRYDFWSDTFTFDANGGGTFDTSSGVNCVVLGSALSIVTMGGAQDLVTGASGFNGSVTFNPARGTGPASDLKVSARLWNSGSVVMNGNGILELSATNTTTGTTTVNAGTLWVSGQTAAGAVTVAGGTLGGTGVIGGATTINAGGTLSPGTTNIGTLTINNTLTLAGSTVMHLNKTAGTADKVQGVSTLTCGGTLIVTNLAGTLATGDTFTLFQAANYTGSFASLVLPALATGLVWDTSSLATSGVISVLGNSSPPLVWNGAAGGVWDIGGTTNWTVGGAGTVFTNNANVRFDDTAGGTTAVTLNTPVSVTGLTFANSNKNYSISGSSGIGGNAILYKSGTGTVTLATTNTYTGTTILNAGTLQVNGTLPAGAVTVATNATLAGNGTIYGPTTVQTGGTLQPGLGGTNLATLTISNSLNLSGNVVLALNRTNAQTASKIAGLGTVTYGGTLTVTNVGPANFAGGDTFTLFQATNCTGSFANLVLPALAGGLSWDTTGLTNGSIAVTIAPLQLVQNGGFEAGSFTSWTQSGSTTYVSVGSSSPHSGTYSAALGPMSLGYLSQTLATIPGQAYALSFWLKNNGDGSSTEIFFANWGSNTVYGITNPATFGWSNLTFVVIATNTSTVLQFGFRNDPSYFYLDDISLMATNVTLTYLAGANGTVSGTTPQTVSYGGGGTAVSAVPNSGYHFVNWSDSITNNPRSDSNVTSNLTVTANFISNTNAQTYTLTYNAGTNGTISGTTPQTVNYGGSGTAVSAVPNTGCHFVIWSDSVTNNPRTDVNVTNNLTVTATFAANGSSLVWDADAGTTGAQDGSGTWGSGAANWLSGGSDLAWANGNAATFGVNTTTNCTVTITNDVTPTGIIFNATGGGAYTLAGGGGGINLSGAPVITASNNATISAVLMGTGALTKTGSGTLTLTSSNTFTGGTIVSAGNLVVQGPNISLSGIGGGNVTVNAGGTITAGNKDNGLVGTSTSSAKTITINAGGTLNSAGGHTYHLNALVLDGGTISSGAASGNGLTYGVWVLDRGVSTPADGNTSTMSGGNAVLTQSGGTVFNVGSGHTLNVSTVLAHLTASPDNGLIKSGAGVMNLSGVNTYTSATTISGGTLLVNGTLNTNSVTVNSGGTLGGTGVIGGATTIQAGGTFAPGANALGRLTVSNSITLAGGSKTVMELIRNGGVATNDLTFISGTLTQGGSLVVTNIGTNNLTLGDSFKLFNAATYAGAFTNLTLPALTNGVNWNTSTLATNGTISVIASTYALNYLAAANGTVAGAATQTVAFGASGTAVSAVANTGYRFVNWSDGSVANPRTDAGVTNNLAVTANFAPLAPPVITNLTLAASGSSFTVAGTGATNAPYVLLGATNLSPAMWIPLLTNYADASGRFTLTDVQTTNYPRRFYRVQAQ